jgi:hypothetical protein
MHSSLDLELLHGIASSLAAELVLALMDAISIHRFKSSSAFRAMVWELDWWTPLRLVRSHLATFHISSFDDRRFVRWLLQSCAIVAALSRNLVFSHPCTSSCLTFSSRFPTLDVQLPRPGSIGKATHISLVGDVVKRASVCNGPLASLRSQSEHEYRRRIISDRERTVVLDQRRVKGETCEGVSSWRCD